MQPPQQPPYAPPPGHYAQPPKKKGLGCGVIIAIVAAITVPILGILAAIAIPAFTKYVRKSKTSEARVQLAKLYDSMGSYYAEHGRCPEGLTGSAGVTPPLSVNCNDGEGGRCLPGAPDYGAELWNDNDTWQALGFSIKDGHYFHYDVEWTQDESGVCQFVIKAYGDLDDDGVFSTFERAGAADVNGVNGAAGLYIDQELE